MANLSHVVLEILPTQHQHNFFSIFQLWINHLEKSKFSFLPSCRSMYVLWTTVRCFLDTQRVWGCLNKTSCFVSRYSLNMQWMRESVRAVTPPSPSPSTALSVDWSIFSSNHEGLNFGTQISPVMPKRRWRICLCQKALSRPCRRTNRFHELPKIRIEFKIDYKMIRHLPIKSPSWRRDSHL